MNQKHRRYQVKSWESDSIESWWAWIYIGGNLQTAEMICRNACFPSGLCVTVEQVKYFFGGGDEDGVRVGLIQYPPFPEDVKLLETKAKALGQQIAEANSQWSFSIVMPDKIIYHSRRN